MATKLIRKQDPERKPVPTTVDPQGPPVLPEEPPAKQIQQNLADIKKTGELLFGIEEQKAKWLKLQHELIMQQNERNQMMIEQEAGRLALKGMQDKQNTIMAGIADPSGQLAREAAASSMASSPGSPLADQLQAFRFGLASPGIQAFIARTSTPEFQKTIAERPVGNILTDILDPVVGTVAGIFGGPPDPLRQLIGRAPTPEEQAGRLLSLGAAQEAALRPATGLATNIAPTALAQRRDLLKDLMDLRTQGAALRGVADMALLEGQGNILQTMLPEVTRTRLAGLEAEIARERMGVDLTTRGLDAQVEASKTAEAIAGFKEALGFKFVGGEEAGSGILPSEIVRALLAGDIEGLDKAINDELDVTPLETLLARVEQARQIAVTELQTGTGVPPEGSDFLGTGGPKKSEVDERRIRAAREMERELDALSVRIKAFGASREADRVKRGAQRAAQQPTIDRARTMFRVLSGRRTANEVSRIALGIPYGDLFTGITGIETNFRNVPDTPRNRIVGDILSFQAARMIPEDDREAGEKRAFDTLPGKIRKEAFGGKEPSLQEQVVFNGLFSQAASIAREILIPRADPASDMEYRRDLGRQFKAIMDRIMQYTASFREQK